jgi:hypothetical protein
MPPGSFPGGMGGGMPPQMGGFPGMGGFLNWYIFKAFNKKCIIYDVIFIFFIHYVSSL